MPAPAREQVWTSPSTLLCGLRADPTGLRLHLASTRPGVNGRWPLAGVLGWDGASAACPCAVARPSLPAARRCPEEAASQFRAEEVAAGTSNRSGQRRGPPPALGGRISFPSGSREGKLQRLCPPVLPQQRAHQQKVYGSFGGTPAASLPFGPALKEFSRNCPKKGVSRRVRRARGFGR